ncbi:hypothetical protein QN277_005307 [Acacia crassicarpa]|uniref:Uncharacterized protein n=1 Tax=Acacia crassicarpa TaxID=499986 RepID=A0AAE1IW29_9FABA|nr:hypothetical protein QN277_005307 [Acacia crassicarpa]
MEMSMGSREDPAILQFHKWGSSEAQLNLYEFHEVFLSPTRQTLILLTYQYEALLVPLITGDHGSSSHNYSLTKYKCLDMCVRIKRPCRFLQSVIIVYSDTCIYFVFFQGTHMAMIQKAAMILMNSVKQRGLAWPRVFYRSTVATGGYARSLAYNPSKMEVFNGILFEKLKQAGVVSGVIDNFNLTYPWHFNNRCNDGVHYGRAPLKMKWRDGQIGHQYFVDLMLAHVLLNATCAR